MKMYFLEVFIWTFAIYGFIKFISEFWLDISVGIFNITKEFVKFLDIAKHITRKV